MSTFRSLLTSSGKLLGGQWLNMALLFAEGVLLARVLGAGGLGNWAVVQAIFSTVGALLGFRTAEALIRYLVRAREASQPQQQSRLLSAAVSLDAAVFALVAAIGIVGGVVFGGFFLNGGQVDAAVFWIFSLSIVARFAENAWVATSRAERRFWHLSLLAAVASFARLLALAVIALVGSLDLVMVSIIYAVVACIAGIYQWYSVCQWVNRHSLPPATVSMNALNAPELVEFRSFIFAGFVTSSLSGLVKNVDILILGAWRPAEEVGWYRIARSLAASLQSVSSALGQVIFQDFSEWVERGRLADARAFTRSATMRLSPLFFALYVAGGGALWVMIPYVYGVEFETSRFLLIILLVGTWVSSVLFWVTPMLLALEKLRAYIFIVVVTSLVSVALYMTLIPEYGAIGSAISLSLAWCGGHLGAFIYIVKLVR